MRVHGWWVAAAAAAALAAPAAAQQAKAGQQAKPGQAGGQAGTSDAFEQACIDLIHGRVPPGGPKAIKTLQTACAGLVEARAAAHIEAAERQRASAELQAAQGQGAQQAQVQAGQSSAQPQQGQGVLASFEQAGHELVTQPGRSIGMTRGGPVVNTLMTNPVGYFNGLGFNLEYFRVLASKWNVSGGARYSKTDASNGTASTFGIMGGVDFFATGRNNEGLRIGPRIELALGRENFGGDTTFARLGLSGEVGYNFIATNGLTGIVAGGIGGRVAGDSANENFESFTGGEFGAYLKIGLGYSW